MVKGTPSFQASQIPVEEYCDDLFGLYDQIGQ